MHFGAVQDKDALRKIYNHEVYKPYKEPDITKYMKISRLN
jgi:hypothetical protein